MSESLNDAYIDSEREISRGYSKDRRARLASQKLCINSAVHGPATHGCRCHWCSEVHKRGIVAVLEDPAAPARPPNYRAPRQRNTTSETAAEI